MKEELAKMQFIGTDKRPPINLMDIMRQVVQQHGVSYGQQVKEIFALSRNHIQLAPDEYYYYRLFLQDKPLAEKKQFVGKTMQRAIFLACNKFLSWQTAADKLAFYVRMQAEGFRIPQGYAFICSRPRTRLLPCFNEEAAFKKWFFTDMPTPSFCKPVDGVSGRNAFLVAEVDKDTEEFIDAKGRRHAFADLWRLAESQMNGGGVIVQEAFYAPEALTPTIGKHLATVRLVVILKDSGPEVMDAAWRIPSGANSVDNFSFAGNLFAGVDSHNGTVLQPVVSAAIPQPIDNHPDTGNPITGLTLPHWQEAVKQVCLAAPLFSDIAIQSWDVALTDQGVVFIEMNPGGNIDNCQVTQRKGVWEGDFIDFVREQYRKNINDPIRYPRKQIEKLLFAKAS